MNSQEELISLLKKQALGKSDAIIVLEGDGFRRLELAAHLYKEGFAPVVVLSGGLPETEYSVPAQRMAPRAVELGIPEKTIVIESRSQNTKEQAFEVIRLAQERGWRQLIVVASDGHEVRAFLSFLKSMNESGAKLSMYIASPDSHELSRREGDKISKYQKTGDVASWEEGVQYLQWMRGL